MINISEYMNDGACLQAQAVLIDFKLNGGEGFDLDYSTEVFKYQVKVDRWSNGREQGYVVWLENDEGSQMNIAFFEHRNSDQICAVKWIQNIEFESPTIDNAKFGDVYKNKYDVSKSVGWRQYALMSDWILKQFKEHLK
jgi:hypothetical protein